MGGYHQVLVQFGDVTPFLEKHDEIAPITQRKLLELLHGGKKAAFLKVELVSVVDAGAFCEIHIYLGRRWFPVFQVL